MTRFLADAVLRIGGAVFVAVGALGVLTGPFEWQLVDVGLGAAQLDPTFLGQQRFLKALELGLGLAVLALREDLLTDRRLHAVFTATFVLTPAARLLGCAVDGMPHPLFLAVLGAELVAAVALVAHGLTLARSARIALSVGG